MADISMYAVVASLPEAEERFDGFEVEMTDRIESSRTELCDQEALWSDLEDT